MTTLADLVPEPHGNDLEAVLQVWSGLLNEYATPVKRRLAEVAVADCLMPADVAVALGTTEARLVAFFKKSRPLDLDDEALTLLKRLLKLPRITLRIALGQLRLSDCVSATGMSMEQRYFQERYAKLASIFEDGEVVMLATLLARSFGDRPPADRLLIEKLR